MSEYKYKIYTPHNKLSTIERVGVANFLFEHLDKYADSLKDIKQCLDYSMKEVSVHGGFVITASLERVLLGVVVVNNTGMNGYIPENVLVYIAVHKKKTKNRYWPELSQESVRLCRRRFCYSC